MSWVCVRHKSWVGIILCDIKVLDGAFLKPHLCDTSHENIYIFYSFQKLTSYLGHEISLANLSSGDKVRKNAYF